MREMRKVRNRLEFSLDNRQVAMIFSGVLIICVLMFALGVMVGKGMVNVGDKPEAIAAVTPTDPAGKLRDLSRQAAENGAPDLDSAPFRSTDLSDERSAEEKSKSVDENAEIERVSSVYNKLADGKSPAANGDATAEKQADKSPAPKPTATKPAEPPNPQKVASIEDALNSAKEKEASASAPAPKANSSDGKYTIQVGSFQQLGEAEAMSGRLKKKGYTPYIVTADIPSMGTWHRVRVGHFKSRGEAQKYADQFKSREGIDPFVAINPR